MMPYVKTSSGFDIILVNGGTAVGAGTNLIVDGTVITR